MMRKGVGGEIGRGGNRYGNRSRIDLRSLGHGSRLAGKQKAGEMLSP